MKSKSGFSDRLLEKLNELRVTGHLCDIILRGGQSKDTKTIVAHRNVLAAASPYFSVMFLGGLAEQERREVVISQISYPILKMIINFIYSGEISVTQENVQDLLVAGDFLELKEITEICTNYMIQELDVGNSIGIYRFAEDHHCLALKNAAFKYINENFVSIASLSEELHEISLETLLKILSSEFLQVDSEFQVFSSAMNWIFHDIRSRRKHVFDILKYIRLSLITSKIMKTYIATCSDLSLKVALESVNADLIHRRGNLVALSASPRFGAKKNIYILGGCRREGNNAWTKSESTYKSIEMYDTFHEKWSNKRSDMKIGRILPGLAVLNGMIFVCGGEIDLEILANAEMYDPNENSWREIAAMTIPRCEFGMCSFNGFIYAFGGWVGEDINKTIERYDYSADEWQIIGEMPEPLFSMEAFSYQDLIYLVGGNTRTRWYSQDLVSYNAITGDWSTYASMLRPRSQMGIAVLNDYLYVVGGTNRQNEIIQYAERYSFLENRWEEIPPMFHGRARPSVAASNGKLYVFGGDQINQVNFYRARTSISSVECYDPLTNKWSESKPLSESRSEARAVVL